MKYSGGDLVENGCFINVKLANVGRFSDFLMKDGSKDEDVPFLTGIMMM